MIKKLDHLVITTSQINECEAFYKKLGFTIKNTDGRYEFFAGDFKINVHILGKEFSPHAKYVTCGSADLCFEIDGDLNEYKKELEANNITIELGIVERIGAHGLMDSIYMRDPDENLLEFCAYKK